MAIDTFSCPECQVKLRRSSSLSVGARVQCPKCRFQFSVPPPEEEAPPAAPPPAPAAPRERSAEPDDAGYGEAPVERRPAPRRRDEEDDRGRVRGRDREEYVGTSPRRGGGARLDRDDDAEDRRRVRYEDDEDYPPSARIGSLEDLSSDYKIDLSRWFSITGAHFNALLGASIGFMFVMAGLWFVYIILAFIPIISLLAIFFLLFVIMPVLAGQTGVCLTQMKGKPWTFGDFFKPFSQHYVAVLVVNLLLMLVTLVCLIPGIVIGVVGVVVMIQAVGPGQPPGPEILLPILGGLLVSLPFLIYFYVRLEFFALPLVLDRNYGPIEAMIGSWRLCRGHMLGVIGVYLLLYLINMGGSSLCYIGLLFTVPYTTMIRTAGYMLVAGTEPPLSREDLEDRPTRRRDRDERDEDDY